jgi:hypothetical protein
MHAEAQVPRSSTQLAVLDQQIFVAVGAEDMAGCRVSDALRIAGSGSDDVGSSAGAARSRSFGKERAILRSLKR